MDPQLPCDRFINIRGVRLQYLEWGSSSCDRILILLHGLGDNCHAFDDLAPAFADSFRVLAYSRRGHGSSEAEPPYDTVTLTDDLRGLMDALNIERAALAGWSMGGNEITALAARYPERVDRLIYLDAGYDWADPQFSEVMRNCPRSLAGIPSWALQSFDSYRQFFHEEIYTTLDDMRRVEAYLRAGVSIRSDRTVVPKTAAIEADVYAALAHDPPRDYAHIRCPVLALYPETMCNLRCRDPQRRIDGELWEERYIRPFRERSIERIRREISQSVVRTVPGNHVDFFLVSRDQVVAAMRSFLSA